jgi:hypothetical protein
MFYIPYLDEEKELKKKKVFTGMILKLLVVVIANGEVGISGSRRKAYRKSPRAEIKGAHGSNNR